MSNIINKYFNNYDINEKYEKMIKTEKQEDIDDFYKTSRDTLLPIFNEYLNISPSTELQILKNIFYKDLLNEFQQEFTSDKNKAISSITIDIMDLVECVLILNNNNKPKGETIIGRKILENYIIAELLLNSTSLASTNFINSYDEKNYEWLRPVFPNGSITFKRIKTELEKFSENSGLTENTIYDFYKFECKYVHCNPDVILNKINTSSNKQIISTYDKLIYSLIIDLLLKENNSKFTYYLLNFIKLFDYIEEQESKKE